MYYGRKGTEIRLSPVWIWESVISPPSPSSPAINFWRKFLWNGPPKRGRLKCYGPDNGHLVSLLYSTHPVVVECLSIHLPRWVCDKRDVKSNGNHNLLCNFRKSTQALRFYLLWDDWRGSITSFLILFLRDVWLVTVAPWMPKTEVTRNFMNLHGQCATFVLIEQWSHWKQE